MGVRTAVVGVGHMAQSHLPNLARFPDVDLVALCDVSEERLQESAQQYNVPRVYTDLTQMLDGERLDCVFIITPEWLHAKQSIECLHRGLDVFCEKPPSHNVEESKRMAEETAKSGKLLALGFNRRFSVTAIKEAFAQTPPQMCIAEFIRPVDEYRPLINGSIHALDALIYICGEPQSVAAVATYTDPEKHECIAASIKFANGALASLASGYGTRTSAEKLSVYGHGVAAWWDRNSVTIRRGDESETRAIGNSVRQEDRHFIDCVKGETEPIATIDDAVVTMEWVHRVFDAAGIQVSPAPRTGRGYLQWCPYCGADIVAYREECVSCGRELGAWSIPIEAMAG
jgi:virulence factor